MQPGERLNGIQEVIGSIPIISTKSLENLVFSRLFSFETSEFAGETGGSIVRPAFLFVACRHTQGQGFIG